MIAAHRALVAESLVLACNDLPLADCRSKASAGSIIGFAKAVAAFYNTTGKRIRDLPITRDELL